jgi:hypothetical protein
MTDRQTGLQPPAPSRAEGRDLPASSRAGLDRPSRENSRSEVAA